MESSEGEGKFVNFVKNIPEGLSSFDYFTLLDHFSKNKIDKETIMTIMRESI
jgi:hypothetical protein